VATLLPPDLLLESEDFWALEAPEVCDEVLIAVAFFLLLAM